MTNHNTADAIKKLRVLTWALAVLGKRPSCVRMHEAGPYQRLKRTEPIAPVSTAAR